MDGHPPHPCLLVRLQGCLPVRVGEAVHLGGDAVETMDNRQEAL